MSQKIESGTNFKLPHMHLQTTNSEHHASGEFGYQNFGAQLTMEFFNATKFANIVTNSGAKYLVFTSKHHDGYTNFNSQEL